MINWVLVIAGFAALIVLHELGHFMAAKATGMRVERFFLFFPPKLLSVRRGETEYGIGAIPLGGYVRITGMNPREEIPEVIEPTLEAIPGGPVRHFEELFEVDAAAREHARGLIEGLAVA